MADCRSLIEFLRAFDQHHRRGAPTSSSDPSSPRPRRASLSSSSSSRPRGRGRLFPALCDHSPLAVVDALALLASLAALAFLAAPYARLLAAEARDAVATVAARHPAAPCVPLAAGVAAGAAVLAWDAAAHRARRCGPAQGRRVRHPARDGGVRARPAAAAVRWSRRDLGDGTDGIGVRGRPPGARGRAQEDGAAQWPYRAHPPRAVWVPKERMEVWGAKKVRRIKK
ncbi:hypothetical protein HU200_024144 [Digitaria exilis]|uniref:Uncharacterized protein n=1 Tax=Digitaria exilis TaxID=1010633 RepID=A0A835BY44_9POAL|nr:hypothetical protein HU200_024144 [Digitaria exilis]